MWTHTGLFMDFNAFEFSLIGDLHEERFSQNTPLDIMNTPDFWVLPGRTFSFEEPESLKPKV